MTYARNSFLCMCLFLTRVLFLSTGYHEGWREVNLVVEDLPSIHTHRHTYTCRHRHTCFIGYFVTINNTSFDSTSHPIARKSSISP